ncbi:ras GTPase-activating protein 3-like isoform X1, partial [Biomphalaria pfeifferi]
CKSTDHSLSGCTPVTSGLQLTNIQTDFDSDREVEKIHSLFLDQIDKLDALQ